MKIALLGTNKSKFNLVFSEDVMKKLKEYGERKRELEQKLAVQKDRVDVSFPCVEVTKEVLSVVCNRITVDRYGKIKIFVK